MSKYNELRQGAYNLFDVPELMNDGWVDQHGIVIYRED